MTKRLGKLGVVLIPGFGHFRQLSVPLADFRIKFLIVARLRLEAVKVTNPIVALSLLREDTSTKGIKLLQLLLIEVGLHVVG